MSDKLPAFDTYKELAQKARAFVENWGEAGDAVFQKFAAQYPPLVQDENLRNQVHECCIGDIILRELVAMQLGNTAFSEYMTQMGEVEFRLAEYCHRLAPKNQEFENTCVLYLPTAISEVWQKKRESGEIKADTLPPFLSFFELEGKVQLFSLGEKITSVLEPLADKLYMETLGGYNEDSTEKEFVSHHLWQCVVDSLLFQEAIKIPVVYPVSAIEKTRQIALETKRDLADYLAKHSEVGLGRAHTDETVQAAVQDAREAVMHAWKELRHAGEIIPEISGNREEKIITFVGKRFGDLFAPTAAYLHANAPQEKLKHMDRFTDKIQELAVKNLICAEMNHPELFALPHPNNNSMLSVPVHKRVCRLMSEMEAHWQLERMGEGFTPGTTLQSLGDALAETRRRDEKRR